MEPYRDFARRMRLAYRDAAAYAAAQPDPALVLWLPRPRGEVDEARSALPPNLRATRTSMTTESLLAAEGAPTHVALLRKNGRNPFTSIVSVGRAPDNDVPIDCESVSKVHAVFSRAGATWQVANQRATNGLLVALKRVEPGEQAPLADGALICFGSSVRARFHTAEGLFRSLIAAG